MTNAILTGLILGGMYALIAMGLTLQYGVARIMNLSYGEFLIAAAFASHWLFTGWAISPFVGLALVVDARHGLSDLDRQLLAGFLPSGRPVAVLATKMDKLTPSAQRAAAAAIERDVAVAFPAQAANVTVIPFSATKRTGVERAETLIAYWLGEGAPPGEAAIAEDQKKGPRGQGE